MPRIEPRAYLRFVVEEWGLLDAIYERTRHGPIRTQTLYELAAQSRTQNVVQRLVENGIIVQLPNSPAFEMGEFVQDIMGHLKKEHSLGLADEIRVYLEDLDTQTGAIIQALDESDHEKLDRHARMLGSRIKTIQRHLNTNADALGEIVTRAKTRKRYIPLRQRYGEVLEAWESYVDPVREMIDPSGAFAALFERLENELQHAVRKLSGHGRLVTERRQFEVLLYRLMALRSQLSTHVTDAREHLLPLVKEIRRNSTAARGASIALKRLRQDGVNNVPLEEWIPVSRKIAPNAIAGVDEIEAYLADLGSYSPEPQTFVSEPRGSRQEIVQLEPEDVLDDLRRELPVDDLFQWLVEHYDERAELDDLLDTYFTCSEPDAGLVVAGQGRGQYETRTHRIAAPRIRVESGAAAHSPADDVNDSTESPESAN